jgi:hypothetical protein
MIDEPPRGPPSHPPGRSRSAVAGTALLALSLLAIGIITLSPAAQSARLPFWCFRCGSRPAIDVLLNILMFVPVGAALALLRVRARWALATIVLLTAGIEVLQFAFIAGRFASARDIVANTIGGVSGWYLALAWRSIMWPSPRRGASFAVALTIAWIATQAFTAWAMTVVLPPGPWWAQIRLRDLGFPAVFRGDVVRLSLGITPIVYSDQLEHTEPVREQLMAGAPMRVEVTGVGPTNGPAPILLLATDDVLSEIAGIVQTHDDAFFRIRTRAAVFGLRNPGVRLTDAFPASSIRDTISITAERANGRYHIVAERAGQRRERTLAVSPSWAWALLVPIPHYSFGREVRWLTAVWLFGILGAIGYWSAHARAVGRDAGAAEQPALAVSRVPALSAPSIALIGIAVVIGLAPSPLAFGVPVAHWSEWVATIAGAATGALVGARVRERVATGPAAR